MALSDDLAGMGHLVDGLIRTSDETFDIEDPAEGVVVAHCPRASGADLELAIRAACRSAASWAATPLAERARCIDRLARALVQHGDRLSRVVRAELGRDAAGELWMTGQYLGHLTGLRIDPQVLRDDESGLLSVELRPSGVTAVIVPWNAPLFLLCDSIAPALLAGNTVIAKPAPETPLSALVLATLIKDVFPSGVLNILAGGDDLGEALVANPEIRMICFTGSVSAGERIMGSASRGARRLLLELGGNDAAIVLPDADLDVTAAGIFAAAFGNAGQVCAGVKRVYVHESIHDELLARLIDAVDNSTLGRGSSDPSMIGPLVSARQRDRVVAWLNEAVIAGAKVHTGGEIPVGPGYFFPPTIVTGVGAGVRLVDDEQFGPVLPVMSFREVDEAVAAANRTDYGLAGSVWGSDLDQCTELARRLECGTAWVNTHSFPEPNAPFGGWKSSGLGRIGGPRALEAYCETQSILVKR